MSCFRSFAWSLLFLCIVSAPIAAKGVNLTGAWDLTVELPADGCRWTGSMTLVQTGMTFTGSVALDRIAGVSCPATLSGTVSGTVSGSGSGFTLDFGLASGEFGNATFNGIVSDDGLLATGTWSGDPTIGTWSAQKHVQGAPTLSGIGLATLFGLLTAAGVLSARRRAV